MAKRNYAFLLAIALSFSLVFIGSEKSFAKDKDLTPEEVITAHLKSIGTPETLASIKNRGVSGTATVEFIQGGTGKMLGESMLVSAGTNMGLIMRYGGLEYPGEYFAYNGLDVTVSTISPGQRSPLADFIFRYKGVMREGLMGGVLSLGWPLLDITKKNATLKCSQDKVDGRDLYVIEYLPKDGMNDVKVKLYFEPATFHHVRTEYRLRVRGEQALQSGSTVTRGVASSPGGGGVGVITRDAGIQDQISDSIYVLTEKFDSFKEVKFKEGTMTLPQKYTIDYSHEGQGSSFLAHYSIGASKWIQNGKIDASVFIAH